MRAGTNPSGDLSLRLPSHRTETTAGADEQEAVNHTGMIGGKLLGDAPSRGHAHDVDGLVERRAQSNGMLGSEHRHRHPHRQSNSPVEIEHPPRPRPRSQRALVHPPRRTRRDAGVG